MERAELTAEVDRNYDFFQRNMTRFLPEQFGRYALLRHRKIVGFFDDASQAEARGEEFDDQIYSIQLVDPDPVNLGAFSNG